MNEDEQVMTKFEKALADVCDGYIGHELGWEDYIHINAKALLKIAKEEQMEEQKDNMLPATQAADRIFQAMTTAYLDYRLNCYGMMDAIAAAVIFFFREQTLRDYHSVETAMSVHQADISDLISVLKEFEEVAVENKDKWVELKEIINKENNGKKSSDGGKDNGESIQEK